MTVVYKKRYNSFFKVEDGVKSRITETEWLSGMGLLGEDDASREGDLWEETGETGEEKANEEKANEKEIPKGETYWRVLRENTVKKLESGKYDYSDLSEDEWNSMNLPTAD